MPSSEDYRISSLEIENFRQYRNAHIKFSRDPQKAFTIIRGSNGAGKTNIMNAITWCLYGTEKHIGSSEKDFPTINSKALKEKPDGIVNMQVRIKLADSKGDKFMIQRHLSLHSSGELNMVNDRKAGISMPKNSTPSVSTTFRQYDSEKRKWQNTECFDKEVKSILPKELATYFIFDGENLENIFGQTDSIKKGIEGMSQIDVIEHAIETLNELILQKINNAENLNPQIQEYRKQVNEKEDKLKKRECIEELYAKIANVYDVLIKKLSSEGSISNDRNKDLNQKLGYNRKIMEEMNKQLHTYNKNRAKETSKDSKQKYLARQLDFCQEVLSDLIKIKNELIEDVRNAVQHYTKEYFSKFLVKKHLCNDVIIDENYQIAVYSKDGYNVMTGLAAGEKSALALSFIVALQKITGFGFPFLMGMPLGRGTMELRHNIASELPVFLKKNQVTLLTTDAEYQAKIQDDDNNQTLPPIRDTIERYVGVNYEIKFTDGESKIVKLD